MSRNVGVFAPEYSVIGDNINLKRGAIRPMAKEFKRLGRLRLWSNPKACTMCRYIFRDIQHSLLKGHNLSAGGKLFTLSISGVEILMGSDPKWRKEYNTVICVGECTRRMAKKGDYIHIPGCPPTISDFFDGLP
jgi:hypothetical protein